MEHHIVVEHVVKQNVIMFVQESLSMFMMPELLPAMLSVEALEDNEVLKVEGVRTFSRISDKKHKTNVELLDEPKTVRIGTNNLAEISQITSVSRRYIIFCLYCL